MRKEKKIIKRIVVNIALFASVLFLPWWMTLFIALLGFLFISSFYEGIFWGFLIDILYGTGIVAHFNFAYFIGVLFLIFFFVIEYTKKYLRLYN